MTELMSIIVKNNLSGNIFNRWEVCAGGGEFEIHSEILIPTDGLILYQKTLPLPNSVVSVKATACYCYQIPRLLDVTSWTKVTIGNHYLFNMNTGKNIDYFREMYFDARGMIWVKLY